MFVDALKYLTASDGLRATMLSEAVTVHFSCSSISVRHPKHNKHPTHHDILSPLQRHQTTQRTASLLDMLWRKYGLKYEKGFIERVVVGPPNRLFLLFCRAWWETDKRVPFHFESLS